MYQNIMAVLVIRWPWSVDRWIEYNQPSTHHSHIEKDYRQNYLDARLNGKIGRSAPGHRGLTGRIIIHINSVANGFPYIYVSLLLFTFTYNH